MVSVSNHGPSSSPRSWCTSWATSTSHATETVKLTGQQLSAFAYLAINKNVARVELLEAISKDRQAGQDRVRDVLYALRRALGTDAITADGDRIQTGPTVTTDLDLFDTLATRARIHPHDTEHCLAHMLDLAHGRPFTYPTRASDHWRWINTDYLTGTWEGRVADTALELARHQLAQGNAVDAHATAQRGLHASPLNT